MDCRPVALRAFFGNFYNLGCSQSANQNLDWFTWDSNSKLHPVVMLMKLSDKVSVTLIGGP
jgi:hypothetical protein